MFVRCKDCGWEQDDFWNENYNPFRSLLDWEEVLLNNDLDEELKWTDAKINTYRQLFVQELERTKNKIKNMHWQTKEDFKNDPQPTCPNCNSRKLTTD